MMMAGAAAAAASAATAGAAAAAGVSPTCSGFISSSSLARSSRSCSRRPNRDLLFSAAGGRGLTWRSSRGGVAPSRLRPARCSSSSSNEGDPPPTADVPLRYVSVRVRVLRLVPGTSSLEPRSRGFLSSPVNENLESAALTS